MSFTLTQYETALHSLSQGVRELQGKIPHLHAAATTGGRWYLPAAVKDTMAWAATTLTNLLQGIIDTVVDLMRGAIAPARMFVDASAWQDIRGTASQVSGVLKDTALSVDDSWKGKARDGYVKAIKPQSDAADRLAKIATQASESLVVCAAAGLTFYVALGAIVAKYILTAIGAIAALESAVFSWVGIVLIVEETSVGAGLILGLIASLTALLGTQAAQMVTLQGEVLDASMFPAGHWPDPAVANYSDATVKDDDADWSLHR